VPWFPNLRQRRLQPEVMDQPGLDRRRHFQALRGLERINFWSRSAAILRPPLAAVAPRNGEPVRVLDVAVGAGDVPLRLWRWARRANLPLEIAGCDLSPDAVEYATARAAEQGAGVRFFVHDALAGPLPTGYDVVTSSLFLHHLDEDQAIGLLRRMAEAAGRLVLVNDLERSAAGLALAVVGTRLLSRSDVVHVDGPRSVEGAFTLGEARRLAEAAGLTGASVRWRWPFRYLLSWARP
jgi:SAM-dependent methyltransferase